MKDRRRRAGEREPEVETPEIFEMRRAHEGRITGTTDRALLAEHVARARAQRDLARRSHPPAHGRRIAAKRSRVPKHPPMFAKVLACMEIEHVDPIGGALSMPIDRKSLDGVLPRSVRLARWDPTSEPFQLLSGSLFDGGDVTGQITRGGTYAALGLPDDPRVLGTIDAFGTVGGWLGGDALPGLTPKICGLILCGDPVDGGASGGSLCDLCLGGAGLGIDLDLFDTYHALPGGSAPQQGLPPAPRCDEWVPAGPNNVPGRITSLAVDPTHGDVIYAGAAAGGVFKSDDAGVTWRPLWEKELSLAIGGIAVAPSDSRIVYAATGEWPGPFAAPNNHFAGVGVYRSADSGGTWDLLAPVPSTETSAAAVDPADPSRVYVAGTLALHRSRDAGRTWDVGAGQLHGILDGVVTDVVVDPADALRVYAGLYNDGVYRSLDGGNTWARLTNGIATGAAAVTPKIALGRGGAHGTRFIAVLMDHKIYTSIDGGTTFTQKANVAQPNSGGSDASWCACIAVDPTDENILIAGHVYLARSADGGATWAVVGGVAFDPATRTSYVHGDTQAVAFGVTDHDRVLVATDGGVSLSTDNGRTWGLSNTGLVTLQCWMVSASRASSAVRLAVTTQDQSCYESTPTGEYKRLLDSEDGFVFYDRNDVIFAGILNLPLRFSTDDGATWTAIHPNTTTICADLAIANSDPRQLLLVAAYDGTLGATWLFRSGDRGTSWTQIFSPAQNPRTAAFAPSDDHHAYVGDASGRVYHSVDAGLTFALLPPGLPAVPVTRIAVDPIDPKRFYVALSSLGLRHQWRGDIGAAANSVTWTDITGRLTPWSVPDLPVTGIIPHPHMADELFVSDLLGVYRSLDGGDSWFPFDDGLPNCYVSGLAVRDTTIGTMLYASTMGRGVYQRRL